MSRPRALDLFCCAGGASMGLHRAGFDVVGVDIVQRKNYPFSFIQADALTVPLGGYDFIWASPPCQAYSVTRKIRGTGERHPELVDAVRARLVESGLPYVIENVVGAPLRQPFTLCGTMFGLKVYRHRLFEASFLVLAPVHVQHPPGTTNASRAYSSFKDGADIICVAGNNFRRQDAAVAMGIDWHTTREEMAQAIPPAYSEFIGRAALAHISSLREAA